MPCSSSARTTPMAAHGNGRAPRPLPEQHGRFAHIVGWGMAVPEQVLTNQDLAAIVETNDEWIRARTGVRERRIAASHESTATLGLRAARNALEVANILPLELDLVIVATSTPDNVFPSTASLVQDQLGATRAGAFDLSAACAGFVYAMNMAAQSVSSGSIETALVIGAETMSRIIDWRDAASASSLATAPARSSSRPARWREESAPPCCARTGSGRDLLSPARHGRLEEPVAGIRPGRRAENAYERPRGLPLCHAHRGRKYQPGAGQGAAGHQRPLVDRAAPGELPHHRGRRAQPGCEYDIFVSNLERYGNTSAASIPIALCEAIADGRVEEGDHIAFCGFGGGLAWAAIGAHLDGSRNRRATRPRPSAPPAHLRSRGLAPPLAPLEPPGGRTR